ncbi:hypothetical protein [Chromobacterium violaceum]|nr:hypothetical protein [Chromobacterium violaceum]
MKHKICLPLWVGVVAALSACSSFKATILPQQQGTYTAVAASGTYKGAIENAVG